MERSDLKYPKLIPGKGWSKNKPTCENAVSQTQNGSCMLWVIGSWFKLIPQCGIVHPYCARFLASLARANERVHEHNERNFPQARLNSEIKARFLLNGHGNFLVHNNGVYIILLNLKK